MTVENTKTKMIPTYGKRPEGLKDSDTVWVQFRNGVIDTYHVDRLNWNTRNGSRDIIAYCEPPEPYVPEPDYSKWVGCLVRKAENKIIVGVVKSVGTHKGMFFTEDGYLGLFSEHELVPPDEIREYLKKAEEACR